MTLSLDLGKTTAKGSTNIFFGIVIADVILAVGAVVLGRLLGSGLYGLYSLSVVPAAFLGLCLGFGVRNAVVKYSSQFSHRDENEKVKMIVASGMIFIAISGFLFALFSFLLSEGIANFFGRPNARFLIEVFSLTILTDALTIVSQSVFVALEKTQYFSILLIFRAILQTTLSSILIVMGLGSLGAAIGFATTSLSTCALGICMVYFFIIRRIHSHFAELKLVSNLKMLIRFGFPLYVRNLVQIGIRTHFLNFLMILYASNILIGNYKVALNFQVLVSFFVLPISTVLLPTFSRLEFDTDQKAVKTVFVSSVKYTSLVVVPATVALIVLSEQLVSILYGQTYELAPLYLSLTTLNFLFAAFGQYSIPALLSSQGETKKSMVLGIANVAVVLPLALILIPRFQIVGLILSLIISGSPTIILGSWWVKRLYNISADWTYAWRILTCSFVTGILTFAVIRYFALSNLVSLIVGVLVFSSSFIIFSPLMGAINPDDISNLRAIFSETGKISTVLEIPLQLLSKFCKFGYRNQRGSQEEEASACQSTNNHLPPE